MPHPTPRLGLWAQALGIPFTVCAAAEKQREYRDVIMCNHARLVQHLFETLEDMVAGNVPCSLHHSASCGCATDMSVSLGITGSPCNPFSVARAKRFSDGSVKGHRMTETTMASVLSFYMKWEPKAGITEQVRGFDMKTSQNDLETPMHKFFGGIVCDMCQ